jgi:hypothetical protein
LSVGCGTTTSTTTVNEGSIFSSSIPSPISTDTNKAEVLLLTRGYGYEYGDIVLLDITTTPKIGDVILYDCVVNKSDFGSFGPRYRLVRVIALPDDEVIFKLLSYEANGYEVILQKHDTTSTRNAIWGSEIYNDVTGLTLQIPEGEYLCDKWIGWESRKGNLDETDYIQYNRFTIMEEAISGIVIKKIGHENIPQITW